MPLSTLKILVDKWSGPAGVTIILGAIVWGVQLNIGMLRLVDEIATMRTIHEDTEQEMVSISIQLAKTTSLLNSASSTLDSLERRMTRNEKWIVDGNSHNHKKNND